MKERTAGDRFRRTATWVLIAGVLLILLLAQMGMTYKLFTSQFPGGNDFAARWFNGCALVLRGENPYADETTIRTQIAMYGRPALPGEDLVAFSYPIYALFLFWPLCYLEPYTLVQAIWMTLMLYGVLVGTLLMIRVSDLRLARGLLIITLIWAVVGYPQARAVLLGQMVILVFIAIGLCLLALQHRADAWAGALLAVATIKPQVVFLLVPWLLWTTARQHRWRFWRAFFSALAGMIGVGILLVPSWPVDFVYHLLNYSDVTISPYYSLTWMIVQEVLGLGPGVEAGVTALLLLYLLSEWWRNREGSDEAILWVTGLTLNLTFFIAPQIATTAYILLLLPIFQLFNLALRQRPGAARGLILTSELFLLVSQWLIFLATVDDRFETLPAYLLLPISLLIIQLLTRGMLVAEKAAALPEDGKR